MGNVRNLIWMECYSRKLVRKWMQTANVRMELTTFGKVVFLGWANTTIWRNLLMAKCKVKWMKGSFLQFLTTYILKDEKQEKETKYIRN